MAKNFISNKDESARLFKSDLLEIFTHVHPIVPVIIYLPAIGWFLYRAANADDLPGVSIAELFVFGVFIWTLTEYLLHRFVFHYQPKSVWGGRLHFLMHGIHHDYPNDSLRLVMPPVVSIPLAALFYALFRILLGGAFVSPFFSGFLLGYLCYDMIHYGTHHFPMKSPVALWLKHHHMRHHYQTEGLGYGVSSPLWDYVFGTAFPGKETAQDS